MDGSIQKSLKVLLSYLMPILDILQKQTGLQEKLKTRINSLIRETSSASQKYGLEKKSKPLHHGLKAGAFWKDGAFWCGGKERKAREIVEIEDKYQVDDIEALQKEITKHNFELQSEIIQEDSYLDNGKILRDANQDLRIRKIFDPEGIFKSGELKWEGPRGKLQDRPVVEVPVDTEVDCDNLKKLLAEKLAIKEFIRFTKHRWYYTRKENEELIEIELDSFDDPSNLEKIQGKVYAQVAREVEPDKRKEAIKKVAEVAKELGLIQRDERDYIEIALE